MISHYVSIALRLFRRHRLYVALNVAGLAIGLAAALLVIVYVKHETSYDEFQPGAATTWRFGTVATDIQGDSASAMTTTLAQQVAREAREVEDLFALFPAGDPAGELVRTGDRQVRLTDHLAATTNLQRFVKLDVLAGDLATALGAPEQIALSRQLALRIFGRIDVIGQRLTRANGSWTVAAVFEDLPSNTHFQFDCLSSARRFLDGEPNFVAYTYVRLAPGIDTTALAHRLSEEITRRAPYAMRASFHPLTSLHLATGGRQAVVNICVALSLVLIAIGMLNFANMSTVQASARAREVGVRKALGASRTRLVAQFLHEALLLALLAAFCAGVLATLALPWFDELTNRALTLHLLGGDGVILLAIALATGVLAGLYPAFVMSGQGARRSLSGELDRGSGAVRVRKSLFVVQAALSAALIVAVLALYQQLDYLQQLPTGYAKTGRLEVRDLDSRRLFARPDDALAIELARLPDVVSVAAFDRSLTEGTGGVIDLVFPGAEATPLAAGFSGAGFGFIDAVGLTLLAGRDFSAAFSDWYRVDAAGVERASIVVTESLARTAGFATPERAIGQELRLRVHRSTRDFRVTVVGVVADLKVASVKDEHRATFFVCGFSWARTTALMLHVSSSDMAGLRARVANVVRQQLGVANPDLRTVEEQYAAIYHADTGVAKLVATFCGLAIALSAIGTFGLAAFSAQRRAREFAVRRVHGASRFELMRLLVNEYVVLVAASLLLAFPIAFYCVAVWLSQFSERIEQSPGLYLLSAVLLCAVTTLTVSGLAVRAAAVRPAAALRHD